MEILMHGEGELLGWHDPDENRAWVRENKRRDLFDKRMSVADAVERFVQNDDYIAFGGFGHVRTPMALVYEIVRQRKRNLAMAGKTGVHDIDILIGAGCISKTEVAYAFGHELRGLSPAGRRAVESGQVQVIAEISNAGYQWRFLAGMMGVPFVISRNMLGTDTIKKSCCKVAKDPWSGKPVCLIPAAYPDVAFFHVHRCDRFGNAQIDGSLVEDFELARAARRVIVSAEEIVDNEQIRAAPQRTVIPYFVVDAVCEVPYGAHPTEMPGRYFFDEGHIATWLEWSQTAEGAQRYFKEFVFKVETFEQYLELVGGVSKMKQLERIEHFQEPLDAPWLEGKR